MLAFQRLVIRREGGSVKEGRAQKDEVMGLVRRGCKTRVFSIPLESII